MKSTSQLITLVALLATAGVSGAQTPDLSIPHLAVFGTAKLETQPDTLYWRLLLQNKAADSETVARNQESTASQTLTFLREAGVKSAEIQTSNMQLSENWQHRASSAILDGYRADTVITFRTSDLGLYQKLWLGLSKIPGVSIRSSDWDSSTRIALLEEARRKALVAAKAKAESMAAVMGVSLLEPISIAEVQDRVVNANFINRVETTPGGAGEEESVSPGTIAVTARVEVSFRIGKK
jgi:uncharacterized protein